VPLRARDQLAEQGEHVAITAGALSAWDAFHRAVPALQRQGKYDFLRVRERPVDLMSAPFDPRFLRRWTTWVDLAQTATVTALVLSERRAGVRYRSFRAHDGAYATSLAINAAVGEEALFRGWLLPVAYQHSGRRFWLGNGLQAGLFGARTSPTPAGGPRTSARGRRGRGGSCAATSGACASRSSTTSGTTPRSCRPRS
jgi:hypothetical protein